VSNIQELIEESRKNPPRPVIDELVCEHETAGLHGAPAVFKTFYYLQLADAIATGTPFLGTWKVSKPHAVFFFETEMTPEALGQRLSKIYDGLPVPKGISFANQAQLRAFKRSPTLEKKFAVLDALVRDAGSEVLMVDTANPFFRGKESPNDETSVGAFFDWLECSPAHTRFFSRHNRKQRRTDLLSVESAAERIRGSGQWADVPDMLMELRRCDGRHFSAILSITKYRHGGAGKDVKLWFDAGSYRLVSVPPVVHLLGSGPHTRAELLEGLSKRFGVEQRAGDEQIKTEQVYLKEYLRGHSKVYELDHETAPQAEWWPRRTVGV
jgi:hypothetical protein